MDDPRKPGPTPDPARGDWPKVTVRVTPELRTKYVEVARALDINYDGVAQIALNAYCSERNVKLPGWLPPEPGSRGPIKESNVEDPKLWVRIAPEWPDMLESLCEGECTTWHGVVRESIRAFYQLGRDGWRAALPAA